MLRQIELQGDRRVLCKEILHRELVPPQEDLLKTYQETVLLKFAAVRVANMTLSLIDSFYDVMKSHMMKRNLLFLQNLVGPHVLSI